MTRLAVACLAYHDVTEDARASGFDRPGAVPYKISPAAFALHLEHVATGPAPPRSVFDIDFTGAGRYLLLTFDDGGASSIFTADALSKRGWVGHFFVVTSLVGHPGFVTVEDIRYLTSCGHVVGSHSHTHPDIFREQTRDQMAAEWRTSCERLSDWIGAPCTVASIPGGDSSPLVLRSAASEGVRHLFTSEPRLNPQVVDGCHVVGRFTAKVSMSPHQVNRLIHFRGWNRALAVRKAKNVVRWTAPWLYRSYVRATTRSGSPR